MDSIDDLAPQLANNRAYWLGWGSTDSVDADLPTYRSDLPHPLLNGVLRLRRQRLDDAVAEARRRLYRTPWLWWVGPDSDPAVADGLLARGASEVQSMPVMAVRVDQVAEVPAPADLVIDQVEGAGGTAAFVEAYAPSMGVPDAAVPAAVEREINRTTQNDELIRFTGRLHGRVVGTAATSISNGVAGIYVVSTDSGYRRRGIGTALTLAALKAGRERGLRVATLQSSADGEPVYRRMGFHTVTHYRLFQLPRAPA
ncbi:GNAT family N-acetyltransferase [Phytoactinopolyspora halotolerans]|uniref:GNAT family N-acetyltransferase n=1 Tax=Phytoactinopolyspora halotolerans TaxID=1981512 RepID=A0A6L9S7Z7_9ACTN|nr:GNAT family N-acetyltransferase [Phytoactinopolyspora halotolerans]NEE01123.1 GNAT family N-acetyltransferase [Phytoactinopolyspora halotolerans]